MAGDGAALTSIEGERRTRKRRAGRRRVLIEGEKLTCRTCVVAATSRFRQAVVAPRRQRNGRITGGSKVWVCDHCGTEIG
jgi:hypothetical protein